MLVELPRQQWVRYDHEFSDESIERLFRMLRSRRHGPGGLVGTKRFPRLRWIVLGALGLLFALIGLAAIIENSSSVSPTPFIPTRAPAGGGGELWCCDLGGFRRCPLAVPGPVGSQCFCPGQGTGITCM